jgi:hypothetical protein
MATLERTYKYSHKSRYLTIDPQFGFKIELPDAKYEGMTRLDGIMAPYYQKSIQQLDTACKNFDSKCEIGAKTWLDLAKRGKDEEAKQASAHLKEFQTKEGDNIEKYVQTVKKGGENYLKQWIETEAKREKTRVKIKILNAAEGALKIAVTGVGATAALAAAALTHGAATPVLMVALVQSYKVLASAVSVVTASLKGLDDAYLKVRAAYDRLVLDLENLQKPKGALAIGSPTKPENLKSVKDLNLCLGMYGVRVTEARNRLSNIHKLILQLFEKQEKLLKSGKTKDAESAKKLEEPMKKLLASYEFLQQKIDNKWEEITKAKKLVDDLTHGKVKPSAAKQIWESTVVAASAGANMQAALLTAGKMVAESASQLH